MKTSLHIRLRRWLNGDLRLRSQRLAVLRMGLGAGFAKVGGRWGALGLDSGALVPPRLPTEHGPSGELPSVVKNDQPPGDPLGVQLKAASGKSS